MDTPVAEAPPRLCDVDDRSPEHGVLLTRYRRVPVTVAGEPHKLTAMALGKIVLLDHLADRFALDLWG